MAQSDDAFADLGPQMVFGMDTNGRCTFSVGAALTAQGLRPGELVGQDLFALYHESEIVDMLSRARSGEAFTARSMANGRLLRTSFAPIHGVDGSVEGSVGVTTDLTDHVRARDDLSRFKALAEDSPNLVAIVDKIGRPLYINPQVAALNLPLSEEGDWSTTTELLGPARVAELQASLSDGSRWSGDMTLRLSSGDIVVHGQLFPLYDADGSRKLGSGWIAQDMTELRAYEAALRATNADLKQFRALVDASSDFIAIAGLDGSVSYLNPAGREMVGMPLDLDVTTTTIRDYLTPDGVEKSEQIEQPAVIEHGRWQGESTLRRSDDTAIPVEIASFLVPDPETGAPFALATVQRDITSRRAAALAQEEFVALVAHELRTPLASVKGYVEIVSDSLTSQPDQVQLSTQLNVAARNIVRMERLVEQILRVAGEDRHHPDRRQPLDLVGVVEQAVESARPEIEGAGLRFELDTCPTMMVTLDETFVEVVDNLVSNAAKYTPSGGQINVTIARENGVAVLSVTDTGSGIPPGERETIFDKFVRGDQVGDQSIPGLGLGLFITRSIVQSHDGEITVHEGPGGGARFVVRLPLIPIESPGADA